jgi:hypothetical protein
MNRRTVIFALALACVTGGGYAWWPRHADLRGFEPTELARLETAMWRDYYEKRFAPDSFRIALATAEAAGRFSRQIPARR